MDGTLVQELDKKAGIHAQEIKQNEQRIDRNERAVASNSLELNELKTLAALQRAALEALNKRVDLVWGLFWAILVLQITSVAGTLVVIVKLIKP